MSNKYLLTYNYLKTPLQLPDFDIFQIGRIYCNENTYYDNHYHPNYYELTLVTDGEGIIYTNNIPTSVKKGDIYLSLPHDIHKIESNITNPLRYDFCAFSPKNIKLLKKFKNLSSQFYSADKRTFQSSRLSYLLPLAINEMIHWENDISTEILNALFWTMSAYITRILHKVAKDDLSITDKNVLCYQIMDYINSNLFNLNSLTVLEKEFNYSYNWLSSVFKKNTSLTIIEFYNLQRLTISKDLIIKKELTLEEIADQLNFSSAFALSKAFKKQFGCSPAQYRKLNKTDTPKQ